MLEPPLLKPLVADACMISALVLEPKAVGASPSRTPAAMPSVKSSVRAIWSWFHSFR